MEKLPISVIILAKNNELSLPETLKSVEQFDEIIVCDTGSSDQTIEIAKKAGCQVFSRELKGFGPLRNEMALFAKNDWVFALDSDETVTPLLFNELSYLKLNDAFVYSFPFKNLYNGRWIRGCGWHPDYHVRLYHRKVTRFSEDHLHEKICERALTVKKLKFPIQHISYRSPADFLEKMQHYSTLFALQNSGKKSSLKKAMAHGGFAFFKSFILKRGFLDGYEGYMISVYNAGVAYYKYLKLAHDYHNTLPPRRSR
ncbi:MAG: glycosyltransferase family 2 protein [Simkaniaceae bacterium]